MLLGNFLLWTVVSAGDLDRTDFFFVSWVWLCNVDICSDWQSAERICGRKHAGGLSLSRSFLPRSERR